MKKLTPILLLFAFACSQPEPKKEVDTEGIEPLTTMSHEVNALREDVVKDHLDHERALRHAPEKDDQYFRVPKVLE